MIRFSFTCLFTCVLSIGSIVSTSAQPCLLADYPFDGDAQDQSVGALHGIETNTTPAPDNFGNSTGALDFNGTSAHVELPDDFDLPNKTVNVWLNANTVTSTLGCVYDSDHPGLQYGKTAITVRLETGIKRLRFNRGPSIVYTTPLPSESFP